MAPIVSSLRVAVFVGLLSEFRIAAAAQPGERHFFEGGFFDGNTYRQMPPDQRQAYVAGVIDGVFFGPAFGANEPALHALKRCLGSMKSDQLLASIDDYVVHHPASWDAEMNTSEFNALTGACRERGTPIF